MPTVTLNLPEPKADPMLRELLKEFRAVAESLRGMKPSNDDSASTALSMVSKQQDSLLKAIERMMAMVSGMAKRNGAGTHLTVAVKGMHSALSGFASDLKGALKASYKSTGRPQVTVKPNITVSMNGMGKKLDRLAEVMATAQRKMRNRTFGSNY